MNLYSQIARNKRNSVFFVILFTLMFIAIGGLVAFFIQSLDFLIWFSIAIFVAVFLQYHFSSKLAVALTHSRPLQKHEHPELYRLVENIAIAAGIPSPPIYIINSAAPNAFAAGKDPENSIVGFTTGLLDILNKQELEGVVAHEISHIKNYDVRYKTIIMALAAVMSLILEIALRFFWVARSGRGNALPIVLIGLVIVVVFWPLSKLVEAAAGREREFLADATGADLTRYPQGLASALHKIENSSYAGDLRIAGATKTLFFDNPSSRASGFLAPVRRAFATHPSTEERIRRLLGSGFSEMGGADSNIIPPPPKKN